MSPSNAFQWAFSEPGIACEQVESAFGRLRMLNEMRWGDEG